MWRSNFNRESTGEDVASHLHESISGKNVLITGCTAGGLGLETALVLAKHAVGSLVITCRSQGKLDEAIKAIRDVQPDINITGIIMDLVSFASIRKAAEEINGLPQTINVLINNAGVANIPLDWTEDGNEVSLQVNHLAPFLLTKLLLPKMLSSTTPPRIVAISSGAQARGTGINYSDPNFLTEKDKKGQLHMSTYPSSKSANSLFTSALARKGQGRVEAISLNPGMIVTGLRKHLSEETRIALKMNNPDGSLNDDLHVPKSSGVATYVLAAFDPELPKQHNGAYIDESQLASHKLPPHSQGIDNEEKCWKMSEELTQTTFIV